MGLPQPSARTIIAVALVLFSSVLLGVGIHHLIATGTCSSNGYTEYGPVPTCPAGTSAWFFFVFGGIIGNVIGAMVAGRANLVFATLFPAIGLGAFTLSFDKHAASFAKSFGLLFGGGFLLVGVISAGAMLGGALRGARAAGSGGRSAAGGGRIAARGGRISGSGGRSGRRGRTAPSTTSSSSAPSWSAASPTPVGPEATSPSSTLLDQISRLSDLRNSGALSEAEFESEKAKLLNRL